MAQKTKHVFQIEHMSEVDDASYVGTFSCKKLSVIDYTRVTVEKTRLNGGMHFDATKPGVGIDEDTDGLNHMFAHLKISLVDIPDWWDLEKIGDMSLISRVYSEVAEFEASFRKPTSRESDGERETGSEETSTKSDPSGDAKSVVGEEVPASLQP